MTDKELLERLRDLRDKLDSLVQAAEENQKHYTGDRIRGASWELTRAEASLAWHVEGT